jgi:xylulokinase
VGCDCLLGLDLGTTTCRAIAFDAQGHQLAEARRELLPECEAPGLAVVHASRWWGAASHVLREVTAELQTRGITPLALGLTGLQHAMVPVDEEGQILAPSMLWMDQRCQGEVDWLNNEGRAALESAIGPGARASTTPSLPRLRWIAHHEPETVARARWFLLPKDYIRYCLTGAVGTDSTDAGGTMLFDGRVGCWSPGLVELALIDPRQLPPILPSESVAGTVTAVAAALTGLPAGLPVVTGMGDTSATRLGSVAGDASCALIYIGTAAWVHWAGPI